MYCVIVNATIIMETLPAELIDAIALYLDPSSSFKFAQTSTIIYNYVVKSCDKRWKKHAYDVKIKYNTIFLYDILLMVATYLCARDAFYVRNVSRIVYRKLEEVHGDTWYHMQKFRHVLGFGNCKHIY
jgi:hypothetical protein